MKNETERLKLRQKYRNEVNPVLAEKHVPKDTYTFTDDYVFWLEEQLVKNIEVIPCCKSDSEQLPSKVVKLANQWLEDGDYYNDFDVEGRYAEVWVKKEEFEKNKSHAKP